MKKAIIIFILMFVSLFSSITFAHQHKSRQNRSSADSLMQTEMAEYQQMQAVEAFPNYHPLIVHFPIVLLLMAFVFQLLSFFYFKKEFSMVTLILLALGVLTAWLASNPLHAMPGELSGKAKEIFETHELMATLTWWFSLVALFSKTVSHFYFKWKLLLEIAVTLLLTASGVTVSIAGHHGAMLVYQQGIGPLGKYLDAYKMPVNSADSTAPTNVTINTANNSGDQKADHHVSEIGKGPHGGTIEEADPYLIEIVADGQDLVFYLLDGDAQPLDMKNVPGTVRIQYANNTNKTIDLMDMNNRPTAMKVINGQVFTAVCTLTKSSKSYTATFSSKKDLPAKK